MKALIQIKINKIKENLDIQDEKLDECKIGEKLVKLMRKLKLMI